MKYLMHAHRHADVVIPRVAPNEWSELLGALDGISEQDVINKFQNEERQTKSLSNSINALLRERLEPLGWMKEAPIFQDTDYNNSSERSLWRLDFAKGPLAVEVAFNHGEAIAWNLMKPVLAGELNHVRKAIQATAGVIVCATQAMKETGGFDGTVGTFEKFVRYLKPFQAPLTVPIMLIGLQAPATFRVDHSRQSNNRRIGHITFL